MNQIRCLQETGNEAVLGGFRDLFHFDKSTDLLGLRLEFEAPRDSSIDFNGHRCCFIFQCSFAETVVQMWTVARKVVKLTTF